MRPLALFSKLCNLCTHHLRTYNRFKKHKQTYQLYIHWYTYCITDVMSILCPVMWSTWCMEPSKALSCVKGAMQIKFNIIKVYYFNDMYLSGRGTFVACHTVTTKVYSAYSVRNTHFACPTEIFILGSQQLLIPFLYLQWHCFCNAVRNSGKKKKSFIPHSVHVSPVHHQQPSLTSEAVVSTRSFTQQLTTWKLWTIHYYFYIRRLCLLLIFGLLQFKLSFIVKNLRLLSFIA